ncbi:MAG TPA: universal stress protein [Solirubrobacterales bacterium]
MGSPFNSILCGVEGNPASTEAARQAIALADNEAKLYFTAVYTSFELGPDYHKDTLEKSLEEAAVLAGDAGVSASYHLREGRYAIDVLLSESKDHDLLVIGTHGRSRARGIMFGSTATKAAHNLEGPLLIARQDPGGGSFAERIVFATDGSTGSWAPAHAAAELAARFESKLEVLHVDDGKHGGARPVIEEQVAEMSEVSGTEPELTTHEGNASKEIVEVAKGSGASLIVTGRRGLKGIKSLGSVSERIVSGAHCSVLLVPAGERA